MFDKIERVIVSKLMGTNPEDIKPFQKMVVRCFVITWALVIVF